jgi:hypothetical protein
MPRKSQRRSRRRRQPWWFMPVVMTGLGAAAVALSAAMMTIVE